MRRLSDTLFLTWLSVLFMLSAFPAQALTCKTTSSTISEVVNIESIIKVSSSELIANKKIWVSSPITATFSCEDTDNFPNGESAYFWLDPENKASSLPDFIQVGITYNGIDYLLQNKKSVEIGPATLCDKSGNTCKSPAIGQTFSLVYQVYIISTGRRVTGEGKIDDNLKLSLFQVDGQGGLRNGTAGANYNLFITGLNQAKLTLAIFLPVTPDRATMKKHAPLPSPMVWSSRVTAVIAGPNLCLLRLAPLIRYRRAPLFCRSRTAASALPSRQTPACIPLLR